MKGRITLLLVAATIFTVGMLTAVDESVQIRDPLGIGLFVVGIAVAFLGSIWLFGDHEASGIPMFANILTFVAIVMLLIASLMASQRRNRRPQRSGCRG